MQLECKYMQVVCPVWALHFCIFFTSVKWHVIWISVQKRRTQKLSKKKVRISAEQPQQIVSLYQFVSFIDISPTFCVSRLLYHWHCTGFQYVSAFTSRPACSSISAGITQHRRTWLRCVCHSACVHRIQSSSSAISSSLWHDRATDTIDALWTVQFCRLRSSDVEIAACCCSRPSTNCFSVPQTPDNWTV